VKRGLGETCQDGARKKAKYLRDIEDARKACFYSLPFCGPSDLLHFFFLLAFRSLAGAYPDSGTFGMPFFTLAHVFKSNQLSMQAKRYRPTSSIVRILLVVLFGRSFPMGPS